MDPNSALVLFSGGQDSTVCLAWALQRFTRVETLGFDYGQRHRAELDARPRVRERMRVLEPAWAERLGQDHVLHLGALAAISDTALTREVAIDEKSAVLLEPDGKGTVVGSGRGAYFLQVKSAPEICRPNTPLTIHDITVYRAPSGARFDFKSWTGEGGEGYSISVENGVIHTTRPGNSAY